MSTLLAALARPATRWPGRVIALIAGVTLVLGVAATNLEMETDLAEFGSDDSEIVAALDRVEAEFDRSGAAVQVIVDAGEGGDVLDASGLAALREVEAVIAEELSEQVRDDADGNPRIVSLGGPLVERLERDGATADAAGDAQVADAAGEVLAEQPALAALTSADRDLDAGSARAATVLAELDPDLPTSDRVDAAERLQAGLGIDEGLTSELGEATVAVSSPELTNEELERETQQEAPLLLGLALLAVIAILWLLLRSVFDVVVGLVGLATTLAWTFGLIAVAGPGMLDWVGPLSQVGVVVPVLVVGLGIDYAVHLTSRYREQRVAGQSPPVAARTAVRTVGAALVVATVATAVGFATTAAAPLEVIADFGVFTAIGVVVAFLVMALLVPAARVLRDRQTPRRARTARELPIGRVMGRAAGIAQRGPVAVLLVAAAVLAVAGVAATDLSTQFDRDDFVPEDSDVGELHDRQDELFAGELTETTYAIVDGDLTDPDVVEALRSGQDNLADVEHVRTDPAGQPQATSVVSLLDTAHAEGGVDGAQPAGEQGPQEAEEPGEAPDAGETPAQGDAADLDEVYERLGDERGEEVERFLRDDAGAALVEVRTSGGDGGAEQLGEDVADAFAPVVEAGAQVSVASEAMVIAEMADDLRDFQAQSVAVTLLAVLVLLAGYYGVTRRRPMLGVIAMIPSVTSAVLILGTMGLLDVSFDALTATLTAIAVGIGVPYGVHVVNRFTEDHARAGDIAVASRRMLATTGGALAGSALTTFGAFVVLSFSGLALIGRMGLLGAAGIAFALVAAVLVQPAALVLWARAQARRQPSAHRPAGASEQPAAAVLLLALARQITRDAQRVEAGAAPTRLLTAAAAMGSRRGLVPDDPSEVARRARTTAHTRMVPLAVTAVTRHRPPAPHHLAGLGSRRQPGDVPAPSTSTPTDRSDHADP